MEWAKAKIGEKNVYHKVGVISIGNGMIKFNDGSYTDGEYIYNNQGNVSLHPPEKKTKKESYPGIHEIEVNNFRGEIIVKTHSKDTTVVSATGHKDFIDNFVSARSDIHTLFICCQTIYEEKIVEDWDGGTSFPQSMGPGSVSIGRDNNGIIVTGNSEYRGSTEDVSESKQIKTVPRIATGKLTILVPTNTRIEMIDVSDEITFRGKGHGPIKIQAKNTYIFIKDTFSADLTLAGESLADIEYMSGGNLVIKSKSKSITKKHKNTIEVHGGNVSNLILKMCHCTGKTDIQAIVTNCRLDLVGMKGNLFIKNVAEEPIVQMLASPNVKIGNWDANALNTDL